MGGRGLTKAAKKTVKKTAAKPAVTPVAPLREAAMGMEGQLRLANESTLFIAMRKAEPGNKPGYASACWKIDHGTRLAMASAYLLDHTPLGQIIHDYRDALKALGINSRAVERWLHSVREEYNAQYAARVSAVQEVDQAVALNASSIMDLARYTFTQLAPAFISVGKATVNAEASPNDMNPILRFMECITDAAKTEAETENKRAQTEKIQAAARQALSTLKGDTNRTPEEVVAKAVDILNTIMLGGTPKAPNATNGEAA